MPRNGRLLTVGYTMLSWKSQARTIGNHQQTQRPPYGLILSAGETYSMLQAVNRTMTANYSARTIQSILVYIINTLDTFFLYQHFYTTINLRNLELASEFTKETMSDPWDTLPRRPCTEEGKRAHHADYTAFMANMNAEIAANSQSKLYKVKYPQWDGSVRDGYTDRKAFAEHCRDAFGWAMEEEPGLCHKGEKHETDTISKTKPYPEPRAPTTLMITEWCNPPDIWRVPQGASSKLWPQAWVQRGCG